MNTKTKTIGYVRVSTQQQADSGQSIEAQVAKLNAYATLYDLEIVEIIIDAGESAKSLNRPGIKQALQALDEGKASALLVTKLDRLTRSVADLGYLIDTYFSTDKFALMSVNDQVDTRTATGRLILNILASVSQWEREATVERTKEVKQNQKRNSKYLGGPVPYGFTVIDGHLVPDQFEQEVIRQAKELRQGGLSLAKVANKLDKLGLRTRNGKVFAATQILRMCA